MFLFWLVSCSAMIVSFACAVVAYIHANMTEWSTSNTIGIAIFFIISWSGLAGWVSAYILRSTLVQTTTPAIPIVW